MWRRFAWVLVFTLLAVSCGDDDTASTSTALTTAVTPSTSPTTSTIPPPTTTSTIPPPNAGLEWYRVPDDPEIFGISSMTAVTAGGPGAVAVGVDNSGDVVAAAVWVSADGYTWQRVPHDEATFGTAAMTSVVAGGPGLVAVGVTLGPDGEPDGIAWVSENGYDWTRIEDDAFGGLWNQEIYSIAAGGPGLVAVGADGGDLVPTIWVSEDGYDWERLPFDEEVFGGDRSPVMWSVAAGGPGLVAVGFDNWFTGEMDAMVWVSEDGYSWSRIQDQAALSTSGNEMLNLVAAGRPGFVAGGDWLWASPDGYEWTRAQSGMGFVSALAAAGPGFVAVGSGGLAVSPDGLDWTPVDDPALADAEIKALAAGGPGVIAVGSSYGQAAVWVSPPPPDGGPTTTAPAALGPTWTQVTDDDLAAGQGLLDIWDVTQGGPGLVAVGSDNSESEDNAAVWVSADGSDWDQVESDVFRDAGLKAVTRFGDVLIAGGCASTAEDSFPAFWISEDGYHWTRIDDPALADSPCSIESLAAGESGLVATNNLTIFVSTDGRNWSDTDVSDLMPRNLIHFSGVAAGGPGFVAVGWTDTDPGSGDGHEPVILASADGLSWEHVEDPNLGSGFIEAVVAGGPGLIAVGYDYGSGGSQEDAVVWVSEDGYHWTRIEDKAVFGGSGSQKMDLVAAGPQGVIATDQGTITWLSPDGYTWTRFITPDTFVNAFEWALVVWEGGIVMAGGDSGGAAVWLSPWPE